MGSRMLTWRHGCVNRPKRCSSAWSRNQPRPRQFSLWNPSGGLRLRARDEGPKAEARACSSTPSRCGRDRMGCSFQEGRTVVDMQEFLKNRSQFPPEELEHYAGKYVAWSPDGRTII